jgi:hypothetical protein
LLLSDPGSKAVRFIIRSLSDAQALPRLVDHFALRGLVPSQVSAIIVGDSLEVVIDHPSLSGSTATTIRRKMENSPLVERVVVEGLDDDFEYEDENLHFVRSNN